MKITSKASVAIKGAQSSAVSAFSVGINTDLTWNPPSLVLVIGPLHCIERRTHKHVGNINHMLFGAFFKYDD